MRVAVTGGAGFIGRHTVAALQTLGHEVSIIDRAHGFDLVHDDLHSALEGVDEVIHLAGVLGTSELFDEVQTAIAVNMGGSARVLDACVKTGAGYVGITMPDCWPSVYQATKLAAVRLAWAYVDAYPDLKVTHVRAYNAYGPDQAVGPGHPQKIVPTFAWRSWRGQPIPIWGEGDQTVDLVHVDHIAKVLVREAEIQQSNKFGYGDHRNNSIVDAGSGREFTVLEIAHKVMDITGCHLVEFLPMRAGELPHTQLCAENGQDTFDPSLFRQAVEAYKP